MVDGIVQNARRVTSIERRSGLGTARKRREKEKEKEKESSSRETTRERMESEKGVHIDERA